MIIHSSLPTYTQTANQKKHLKSFAEPNSRGGGWVAKEKIQVVPNESNIVYIQMHFLIFSKEMTFVKNENNVTFSLDGKERNMQLNGK